MAWLLPVKQGRRVALQIVVLLTLVYPFVSSTFRDNDQATILSSSWQLARGQAQFLHAPFYNFDKQWGVFLALSWLFRLMPGADPVLAANILVTALVTVAWIVLGISTRRVPLPLLLAGAVCARADPLHAVFGYGLVLAGLLAAGVLLSRAARLDSRPSSWPGAGSDSGRLPGRRGASSSGARAFAGRTATSQQFVETNPAMEIGRGGGAAGFSG